MVSSDWGANYRETEGLDCHGSVTEGGTSTVDYEAGVDNLI